MKNLDSQIALVKYYSMREFREALEDGQLKEKAQNELLFLHDTMKFEYYIKRFPLSVSVERRLIESNRKDLFCLYFKYRKCAQSNEKLLVHNPKALSIYAKYHSLSEKAEMEMVQQKKGATVVKYINRRELSSKVLGWFKGHASKELVVHYDRLYPST